MAFQRFLTPEACAITPQKPLFEAFELLRPNLTGLRHNDYAPNWRLVLSHSHQRFNLKEIAVREARLLCDSIVKAQERRRGHRYEL
jgi:hypothetical protein